MAGEIKVERTDPVTGEVTVTHESVQEFMGRIQMPDKAVKHAYLNQHGKSLSEGKSHTQAKAEALEVAKKVTLAQIRGEEIEVPEPKGPISDTRALWLIIKFIVFWTFSLAVSLCFFGFFVGLAWKCFRWAMSL